MAFGGVTQRLLLGLELCVALAAMAHSTHAWYHLEHIEAESCNVAGEGSSCDEGSQMPAVKSIVRSGMGVAVLSLVVLVARQTMIYLQHYPRYVGILYDLVLVTLWLANLASLVHSASPPAAETQLHTPIDDGSVLNGDGTIATCWAERGIAVGAGAVCVYVTRLLLEAVEAVARGLHPTGVAGAHDGEILQCGLRSKIGIHAEMNPTSLEDGEGYRQRFGHSDRAPQALAYSPVLAFFPENVRSR